MYKDMFDYEAMLNALNELKRREELINKATGQHYFQEMKRSLENSIAYRFPNAKELDKLSSNCRYVMEEFKKVEALKIDFDRIQMTLDNQGLLKFQQYKKNFDFENRNMTQIFEALESFNRRFGSSFTQGRHSEIIPLNFFEKIEGYYKDIEVKNKYYEDLLSGIHDAIDYDTGGMQEPSKEEYQEIDIHSCGNLNKTEYDIFDHIIKKYFDFSDFDITNHAREIGFLLGNKITLAKAAVQKLALTHPKLASFIENFINKFIVELIFRIVFRIF